MKREIISTKDGSHTFFVPELNEHYHSINGAKQEAIHVYINAGFNACNKDNICILEMGFGTGLNCLLTIQEAEKQKKNIVYNAIELYPVSLEEVEKLNYDENLNEKEKTIFQKIHQCKWNEKSSIKTDFELLKTQADLLEYDFPKNMYDVVYFDAFAPDIQPKLWTEEIFKKIYSSMKKGGILTTYSAKGFVKQNLRAAGFTIKRLPGPLGKWQMLRAFK